MSPSPLAQAPAQRDAYESSWVAIYRLVREGASWSGRERNCAFLNIGGGRFADASALLGLDHPDDGRAAAAVDWDGDGAVDLWTTNRTGPRVRFLRNAIPPAGEFVAVQLEGRFCNRDAIGARVEIFLEDGRRLARSLRAGDSYLAQSSKWLHFGLGASPAIRRAVVRWPWGEAEEIEGLAPGAWYRIVQGSGRAEPWVRPGSIPRLRSSEPTPPPLSEAARIVLPNPVPLPPLSEAADARSTLLLLWASWCSPCLAEVEELARSAPDLAKSGLRVLALSVDAESDRGKAVAVLDRLRWPFGRGFASAATLAILEIAQRCLLDRHRPLPLPSSFLLDEEGRLAVLYKGSVPVGQLLSDLERLRASPQARLAGAFPFPGRWHAPPPPFDPEVLVRALEARGHAAAARDLEKTRIAISPSSPARIHHEIGLARAREGQLDVAVDLFRRAADLEPGFFEARRDLATALHQRGDLEGAIAEYRAALSIRPADSKTLFNFAVACAQSGDRDGALRAQRWLGEVDGKLAADLLARLRSDRGW